MKLDKWTVILIVALVLIAVLVWLGVKNKWFSPRTDLSIKQGDGDVTTDSNGKASPEYTRIAQNAHDQMIGTNWNIANFFGQPSWMDVIEDLEALNNNELRVVVNEYDRLFDDSSLRSLISNEYTGCGSKGLYGSEHICYKYFDVKERLNQINA
ncbi:hypothetical protein [Aureispira anguillae]|uniref:Uncharacterized protein n=1 Tax=Aureispira anguillae TaxID=2864201 RepID=A0A915YBM8_9BACT|nr:hypothetical protein [Aureispira anguillae]BDS10103.1 hypothetical protein AsAng_0008100 [Aureispira anguillae]